MALLSVLAWLYGKIVALRARAYANGFCETVRLPVPVICVGNLSLGGTGKTPGVIWLLRHLLARGKKPAVITRGYGRENPCELVIVSDGQRVVGDVRKTGDEPQLIARRVAVPVIAAADRALAGRHAIEDFSADVLVMDDGFQHHRLHRDLNIVLWDATEDPRYFLSAGRGLLPAGRLREPLTALSRAGLIFLTKAEGIPEKDIRAISENLRRYSGGKDVIPVQSRLTFEESPKAAPWPEAALRGAGILALSAVARPENFEKSLERLGARVDSRRFRDHHVFTSEEIADVRRRAKQAGRIIVTTEKDALRLPPEFPCVVARLDWAPEGYAKEGDTPSWISAIDSVIS